MTTLIKYDAARTALAECKSVDEVKDWSDRAAALQAYGRMAQDKSLEVDAAEIRIRAERRLGEMLAAQKEAGGLNRGAAGMSGNQHSGKLVRSSQTTAPKLRDSGISKDLSSRAQKLAAVPEKEFEAEVGEWRGRVTAEGARVSARLQQAGERELSKRQQADDAHDDFDPVAELEAAHKEIEGLQALVKVAEENDLKAEAIKWRRLYEDATRKQAEAETRAHRYQKELQKASDRLTRIGKLFNERDPSKVCALVEAFYRQHAKAAA